MQSPYLLSPQTFHQDKVAQLNLKLKRWRLVTLIFLILTILATSILILAISQRNKPIINPLNQVDKVSQYCSDFQFNNTNLTEFTWKIKYKNLTQNQPILNETTKVINLDLSNNKLKNFNNNELPDLEQLNLMEYPSSQYYHFDEVSNNSFSKLKKFSVPNAYRFINNNLPSLYEFKCWAYNVFQVYNFNNNFIPNLNGTIYFIYTNSFVENTLGLQGLKLSIPNGFQFRDNTLLKLKYLQMSCSNQTSLKSASPITNNEFPNLQHLNMYNCNISDLKSLNKLKNFTNLQMTSNFIEQFSNHNNSYLQTLTVYGRNLKTFTNNYFPSLKQLKLGKSSYYQVNICEGNYMPNLIKVSINQWWDDSKSIKNLNCFKSLQKLENLTLYYLATPFQNFNLPQLKSLDIIMQGDQQRFRNIQLPEIEQVKLSFLNLSTSLKTSNINFGNTLKSLYIMDSSILQISFQTQMTNLEQLGILYTNLQSINCSSFKNAKQLYLSRNKLKDNVIDALVECDFKNLKYLFLQQNLIEDKAKARSKLSYKYPNTYVSL